MKEKDEVSQLLSKLSLKNNLDQEDEEEEVVESLVVVETDEEKAEFNYTSKAPIRYSTEYITEKVKNINSCVSHSKYLQWNYSKRTALCLGLRCSISLEAVVHCTQLQLPLSVDNEL